MSWLVPLLLRVVVAQVVAPTLQKILAATHGREERFLLQFVAATVIAIGVGMWSGATLNQWTFVAAGLGALSALGAYCQWRAMHLSLSRYALCTWMDDLSAMFLGWAVLGEGRFFNGLLVAGILLAFGVTITLLIRDCRRKTDKRIESTMAFVLWVAGFSATYGVVVFSIRALALRDVMDIGSFVVGWYPGATSVGVIILLRKRMIKGLDVLTLRDVWFSVALGAVIVAALAAHVWVLQLAPIIATQAIFLIAETTLPGLIGLYFFNEKKDLALVDYGFFALGLVAVLMIALSL